MKFAISIPFYKFMEGKPVESLIAMMADIHSRGDVYCPIFAHSIAIDAARNAAVKVFIKQTPDADYFLSLDTDQVYSAEALYSLVRTMEKNDYSQLSAAYIARSIPGYYAHCGFDKNGNGGKIPAPQKGIIECHTVGFGFNLLRNDFVKRMAGKHTVLFKSDPVKQLGEDVWFCDLQREEGIPVRFDADTKVGHVSSVVL